MGSWEPRATGISRIRSAVTSRWAASWHTYGARVTPGGATFYVDGVEVTRVTGLTHTEEPFYFLLNLALSHDWPIDLARTGETTDLYVDWVRVYT